MMLFSRWLRRAVGAPRYRRYAQQTRRSWIAQGVERLENRRVFAGLAPSDIALSNSSIDENLAPGSTVGEFSTIDADSTGGYVYSFDGGSDNLDNEHFFLTGNVIKTRESFDFESVSSYQVSIRSRDAEGNSFSKVFTIGVNNLAEGAHANDDQLATELNTPISGNVLTNDSADTGGTLTAALGDPPINGTVEFNADGSFTYTPSADFSGVDTFTYSIDDGQGGTDTATVSIVVGPINETPLPGGDVFSIDEDSPLSGNVLENDSDPDGDVLTASIADGPASGTVEMNPDGSFTYTPNANFNGSDSFTYTLDDGFGGTAVGTVTITVNPINDLPTAGDDAISTAEDTPVSNNVLINDVDVDGDSFSTALLEGPANGTVLLNGDGSYTYTPSADFHGSDSFTYTLDDGNGGTGVGTVSVTVTPVNDAPVAGEDLASGDEDTAISGNVLENDSDVDGDTLTAAIGDAPLSGAVELNSDGSFTYTPNADFNGSDSFTYNVADGQGGTATGTVTITVNPVNDAPVAIEDALVGDEDTPATGNVLANDTDIDGDSLTAALGTGPANGVVELNSDGSFTYTPTADFHGSDSFTYTVDDGHGGAATGVVNITMNPVNDAPLAVEDAVATEEDAVASGNVLANDTDVDGDPLTVALQDLPTNGTVELNSDGSFTYTPSADFHGVDTFTYVLDDGQGGTATGTVTIAINPVNDSPIAGEDAVVTDEDVPATGNVLDNDTDIDGDLLTAALSEGPTSGTVEMNSDGTFTYTPHADFHGADSFTYTIDDGNGGTATGVVNITVNPVNDAPVAGEDLVTTDEDVPATGNVLVNDTDIDGDSLIAALGDGPAHGTVELNSDGSFTYTPSADFNGADSFTYTVDDGHGGTATGVVNITISPVNDNPSAGDDAAITDEDVAAVIPISSLLANDTDSEGDTPVFVAAGGGVNGTVVRSGDNLVFTPNANFNGAGSFVYAISDGNGGFAFATVTVTVNGVADPPTAVDDAVSTESGVPLTIAASDLTANDTDPEGDPLTVVAVGGASGGSVVLSEGNVTFTPAEGFSGTGAFHYVVSDGTGGFALGHVSVEVTGSVENTPPVAGDDVVNVDDDDAGDPVMIAVVDLLANDIDADGDSLTLTAVGNAVGGTVALSGDQVVFTPAADSESSAPLASPRATFTYTISDGRGGEGTGTVTLNIESADDEDGDDGDDEDSHRGRGRTLGQRMRGLHARSR